MPKMSVDWEDPKTGIEIRISKAALAFIRSEDLPCFVAMLRGFIAATGWRGAYVSQDHISLRITLKR